MLLRRWIYWHCSNMRQRKFRRPPVCHAASVKRSAPFHHCRMACVRPATAPSIIALPAIVTEGLASIVRVCTMTRTIPCIKLFIVALTFLFIAFCCKK